MRINNISLKSVAVLKRETAESSRPATDNTIAYINYSGSYHTAITKESTKIITSRKRIKSIGTTTAAEFSPSSWAVNYPLNRRYT